MTFETAIVDEIVLDDTNKYFGNVGGYNGIGTVAFRKIKGNYKSRGFAKPYFSNFVNYPLKNELIYIFELPSPNVQENNFQSNYYYISPINVWNSNHHNGLPNIFENNDLPDSQKRDYQQTSLGSVRRVQDGSSDIDLGQTFIEKSNIKPTKKFEGDVIIEGRFGNSVRFGSTVLNGTTPLNNWSKNSPNGSPIIIIRNGQAPSSGNVGFVPTEENINDDLSSIYLTSNQQLPIDPASVNYYSYEEAPQLPKDYLGNQIIISSGRLLFNSSNDHLLLSSAKSISLSSNLSVNIDTPQVIMQSENIYLGSKNASEPLVLGDTTADLLNEVISILKELVNASALAANGGGPIPSLQQVAPGLLTRILSLDTNQIKSKYNYTV
jgi:hypothetical protein